MKRLIVDLDDTLGDLLTPWINRYNAIWEDNLKIKDIPDWDITKFVKTTCGNVIFELLKPIHDTSLWDNMLPMDGAVEYLEDLSGFMEIFVVSSVTGNYDICKYKHKWLEKNFPFLDTKKFYFVSDKSGVSGDYMVDDYYKNMLSFNGKRILFDRPHNHKIIDGYDKRALNWKEVYDIIVGEL